MTSRAKFTGRSIAHPPAQGPRGLEHRAELVGLEREAPRPRKELLSVRREAHDARRPLEEPGAQLGLEGLQPQRHARLGHAEVLAGAREAAELRHLHEDLQRSDVDGHCFDWRNSVSEPWVFRNRDRIAIQSRRQRRATAADSGEQPRRHRKDPTMSTSKRSPVALVTGGSRGLGKSMALHLADRGVDVIITYRGAAADAAEVVKQIEAKGRTAAAIALDLGSTRGFDAFAAAVKAELAGRFGRDRFDYLVNNAGMGGHASFAETTEEQFDALMNVHLKGTFFLTQKLLPLIADGGADPQRLIGAHAVQLPGLRRLRRDEGRRGGADPLPGKGARARGRSR